MFPSPQPDGPERPGPHSGPSEPGVPENPASTPAGQSTVDWDGLPEAVRDRVAELAAAALGKLPPVDVPRQLRPVARFAPAKRARLGRTALLGTLRDSGAFRVAVLEWLREHRQDALDPNAADSVAAAAAAVLLGESDASSRVRLVAKNAEETTLRAERDAAAARALRLETELEAVRAELADALGAADRARGEREAELDRLRGRLREQGVQLRRARDAAEAARSETEATGQRDGEEVAALRAQLDRERSRVDTERTRAERATAEARTARQAAREARQADEVRLALLVDTLDGIAGGLRHELSLPAAATGRRPADTVAGVRSGSGLGGRVQDVGALEQLLALPGMHLVVDGYNVTKTGYPDLPLADQRDRLVQQLGALTARLGAEVTVVWDGAGVLSVPAAAARGVRVLFSDRGVLADDVIRSLVAAEPDGRPVVVATSDRAVAESVRQAGAHAVPSVVLLRRLGRT
ncbi:RNA-binding protein [Amycolatopsis antarctica]|uniref:RNA-binding protein n=1 Tax=Amycolatopsis antarctica TaxID=1854586 RepID=A0A263CWI9_9PSEU|nr:NYN domain-containing protein [Amycolatopsis antarctica]OZM70510.1 RNA-binding protein [Amycolatopsis antarctica]